MYRKALERAELESLNNPNTKIDLDKIQSDIDREDAETLKVNTLNAVCNAVVSAIEEDKKYIGVYCFGKNAYPLIYATEEELNSAVSKTEELISNAKDESAVQVQKLTVNSGLINSCIDFLYDKQKSLPSVDNGNTVTKTLYNRYEAQLTLLENEFVRLTDAQYQDSEQSL